MSHEAVAALATDHDGPFVLETIVLEPPRADEVVVRLVACGLCHTDLSSKEGRTPFPLPAVFGHEGAGVVVEVGADVVSVRPGDRVLLSFASCGACRMCVNGHPSNCVEWGPRNLQRGTRPDRSTTAHWNGEPLNANYFGQSSFAEVALAHERSVVKVPDDLPLPVLASLGCGIQTGVGTVLNVLRPMPDQSLIVFGAGAVGLAAVMGAAIAGVENIVAVDRVASRLDVARQCGATKALLPDSPELADVADGPGYDFAVEATGSPAVLAQAFSLLAPGGACAVVGAPAAGSQFTFDIKFLMRGRKLVGVTQGDSDPRTTIPKLIEYYRAGALPLELITTFYPFAGINDAVEDALSGKSIKPVLRFD